MTDYYIDENGHRKRRPLRDGETLHVPLMAMDSRVANVFAQQATDSAYQRGLDSLNAWRGDGNRVMTPDATSLATQIAARDALLPSTAGNALDEAAAFDACVNDLNAWRDR